MGHECTHNCGTCGSSCGTDGKENKDIFLKIENLVKEFDKDDIQEILANIVEDIDKEDA